MQFRFGAPGSQSERVNLHFYVVIDSQRNCSLDECPTSADVSNHSCYLMNQIVVSEPSHGCGRTYLKPPSFTLINDSGTPVGTAVGGRLFRTRFRIGVCTRVHFDTRGGHLSPGRGVAFCPTLSRSNRCLLLVRLKHGPFLDSGAGSAAPRELGCW